MLIVIKIYGKNDFIDVRKSFMDINLFIIAFGNDFVLVSNG